MPYQGVRLLNRSSKIWDLIFAMAHCADPPLSPRFARSTLWPELPPSTSRRSTDEVPPLGAVGSRYNITTRPANIAIGSGQILADLASILVGGCGGRGKRRDKGPFPVSILATHTQGLALLQYKVIFLPSSSLFLFIRLSLASAW